MQNRNAFEGVAGDFKLLEYWTSFTLLGEDIAECYMRTEDIGSDLLLDLCYRAELTDCGSKDWNSVLHGLSSVNTHKKQENNATLTWGQLEEHVTIQAERDILDHAKQVCLRFGYSDCG